MYPFLVADLAEVTVGHLERRITHQHIDPAEFSSGAIDYRSALRRIGQVTTQKYTFAASVLDQRGDLGGVLVFVTIGDQHVGALAGVRDGHRTTDPLSPPVITARLPVSRPEPR